MSTGSHGTQASLAAENEQAIIHRSSVAEFLAGMPESPEVAQLQTSLDASPDSLRPAATAPDELAECHLDSLGRSPNRATAPLGTEGERAQADQQRPSSSAGSISARNLIGANDELPQDEYAFA